MSAAITVSQWPPPFSDAELDALRLSAATYALSHGLLYLPVTKPTRQIPSSAIHAPFSLLPSPFPRRLFKRAQSLQRVYNVLYARIAQDEEFLDSVMGAHGGAGSVDEFVGQLWTGWRRLRDEGIAQPLQLGLFRSDYMIHAPPDAAPSLKQVEFNTISSSFGPLSERTAAMHRYLCASTGYFSRSPSLVPANFPPNNSTSGLVEGLAAAHKAYGNPKACILFVMQSGERNVFDQRWLDYELQEKHSIHVVLQTFDSLAHSATIDPTTKALLVSPSLAVGHSHAPLEVSTIYFRAGYTPTDFPTPSHYATRILLEQSRAIKCPSIPLQLAGGKKVQQVLTQPGMLERFLCDERRWGPSEFSAADIKDVRESWMEMWGLDDEGSEPDKDGTARARSRATGLVLKPQREGGGNNVYKESIPAFLESLSPKERAAWIAMELIMPPSGIQNYLVRADRAIGGPVKADVISEVGIFGWALFGGEGARVVREAEAGWLVRTKARESNEGGVAAGYSVLDSLVLVDDIATARN